VTRLRKRLLAVVLLGLFAPGATADELHIAVASNFKAAMEALTGVFENQSGHQLVLSYGATGKHYAQIVNGAPFHAFLAADTERPRRLEAEGFAIPDTRITYAMGKLVLWGPGWDLAESGEEALKAGDFRFLAIANPKTAPYGLAAEQTLRRLGLWESLQPRIVRGENIGQAFAHVHSGNAELGFVALSQLTGQEVEHRSTWRVSEDLFAPIEQQAVLLEDCVAARAFLAFLRSPDATDLIRTHGYSVP
jgi:molybdate transport system substrate-binding protein